MERYIIDGVVLDEYKNQDEAEEQLELLESIDAVFYEQFDKALQNNGTEFQMVINDVELDCKFTIVDGVVHYTATRGNYQQEYVFMVDISDVDDIYDSILVDDVTQARLVSFWAMAGHKF
mgnify:FL=1